MPLRVASEGRRGRRTLAVGLALAAMLGLAGCRTWDHHHGHGGYHHYGHRAQHSHDRHRGWSNDRHGWAHRGRYESPSYARPGPPVGRSLGSSFGRSGRSR
jgi:hypothetical protein